MDLKIIDMALKDLEHSKEERIQVSGELIETFGLLITPEIMLKRESAFTVPEIEDEPKDEEEEEKEEAAEE